MYALNYVLRPHTKIRAVMRRQWAYGSWRRCAATALAQLWLAQLPLAQSCDSRCAASRGDHNRPRHRRVQAQDVNIGLPVRQSHGPRKHKSTGVRTGRGAGGVLALDGPHMASAPAARA